VRSEEFKAGLLEDAALPHSRPLPDSPNRAAHAAAGVEGSQRLNPLANVVEREKKRPGFNYSAEADPKKLI